MAGVRPVMVWLTPVVAPAGEFVQAEFPVTRYCGM
jgi:hypothetical protein